MNNFYLIRKVNAVILLTAMWLLPLMLKAQGNYVYFNYNLISPCAPTQLEVFNASMIYEYQGIPVYTWYLNETVLGQFVQPELPVPIDSAGYYTIRLVVTDSFNDSILGEHYTDVSVQGSIKNFDMSQATVCPGEQVFFGVISEIWSVEWDFGDDDIFVEDTKYQQFTNHTYKNAGEYTVRLIAENQCGRDTIFKQITVSSSAIPTVHPTLSNDGFVCPNDPVRFNVEGEFATYLWEFGDGTTSTLKAPVHTYPDRIAAEYFPKITVTNICGGSNFANAHVQIVTDVPVDAGFDYDVINGYQYACPLTEIQFNPFGNGRFTWDFGDGVKSSEQSPVHRYSSPGLYDVTLNIVNGCGFKGSNTKAVDIQYMMDYVYNVSFNIEGLDYNDEPQQQGYTVCPGQLVKFRNTSFMEKELVWSWSFGDEGISTNMHPEHVYTIPGTYEVMLTGTSYCGAQGFYSTFITVNDTIRPDDAEVGVAPLIICPGESVYFYDNDFDPRKNYVYDITFGDGQTITGLKTITDMNLWTLSNHTYTDPGTYNYEVSVTNICGNSNKYTGTIVVDNNAERKTFYYVSNSTLDDNEMEPGDWSARQDPADHEFSVTVRWPAWQIEYGNIFQLFVWYGGIYEEDPGMPDGIVEFTSDSMLTTGEKVTFYVPFNPYEPATIGIGAVYYCGGVVNFWQDRPDAYGILKDEIMMEPKKVPLIPGGITDLDTVGYAGGIIINPDYYGECQKDKIEGTWFRKINDNLYAYLTFYENEESNYYYMEYKDRTGYDAKSVLISDGNFSRYDEGNYYINFSDYSQGEDYSVYQEIRTGNDTIQFILNEDEYADRITFLDGIFVRARDEEYDRDMSACPGDPVKFIIAGGATYLWDFGDGNTSTEQFPLHSYIEPGTYNVKVTATNGCGRVDELFTKVEISSTNLPDPWFYTDPYNPRRLDTITFYSSYSDYEFTSYQYLWDFGDGKTSVLKNPKHVYPEKGEYKVKLTLTNGCGSNTTSQIIRVTENALECIARFTFSIDGNTVDFISTSVGEITSYKWDFGDGTSSTLEQTAHTYTAEGVYFVTLTVYSELTGCVSSQTIRVVVGTPPCEADFDFIVNNNTGLALFTANVIGVNKFYWDFGNGNYSAVQNPENTYQRYGIYNVCLTAWDEATRCMVKVCKDVVYESPTVAGVKADFSYYVDHVKRTLSLTNLSSANAKSIYWTMGDGSVYKINNPVHAYKVNGIYEVCLNVADESTGLSGRICKTITVGEDQCNIKASFTFFVNPEDKTVAFRNDSYGTIGKWFWTFGDGTTATDKEPKKTYAKPGYYLVTLSAKDETQGCSDQYSVFIQVGTTDCRADFSYRIDPASGKVFFVNESTGDVSYYYWEFGDGGFSTQQNPEYTYKRAGVYYPSLTVTNETKTCMDKAKKPLQAGAVDCAAKFTVFVDSTTMTAYFTNRNMGEATQLFWMFGDGSYSTDQNPVHTFPAPGYYSASLNTYNSDNNCMDYYSEIVVISSSGEDLHADFVFRPEPGTGTVAFSDRSTGDITEYYWTFGDGDTSVLQNPAHTYVKSGYYEVCLSAINNFNMPDMMCRWVPVELVNENNCRADFNYNVDRINKKVVFADASIGAPDKWKWEFGDQITSELQNPEHIYDTKGYYGIKLKIENTVTGCRSVAYKLINVDEVGTLKASFTYELDTTQNKKVSGYPADFVGSNLGDGATYEWDFGERKSEVKKKEFVVMHFGSRIITFYYEEPGTYNACLRVTNPQTQQSDTECQDITTRSYGIGVNPTPEDVFNLSVYPNPFTDYTNIIFNLPEPMFVEISVYDRLGRKMETLIKNNKESGFHQLNWDVKTLSPGIYHLRFTTTSGTIVKPLIIAK